MGREVNVFDERQYRGVEARGRVEQRYNHAGIPDRAPACVPQFQHSDVAEFDPVVGLSSMEARRPSSVDEFEWRKLNIRL